jgi:hypothetical protein
MEALIANPGEITDGADKLEALKKWQQALKTLQETRHKIIKLRISKYVKTNNRRAIEEAINSLPGKKQIAKDLYQ